MSNPIETFDIYLYFNYILHEKPDNNIHIFTKIWSSFVTFDFGTFPILFSCLLPVSLYHFIFFIFIPHFSILMMFFLTFPQLFPNPFCSFTQSISSLLLYNTHLLIFLILHVLLKIFDFFLAGWCILLQKFLSSTIFYYWFIKSCWSYYRKRIT